MSFFTLFTFIKLPAFGRFLNSCVTKPRSPQKALTNFTSGIIVNFNWTGDGKNFTSSAENVNDKNNELVSLKNSTQKEGID